MFYWYAKNTNKALGLLLFLSVVNTILTDLLKYNSLNYYPANNLYVFLHHLIWLCLIGQSALAKGHLKFILVFFAGFGLCFLLYNGLDMRFHYEVFILGALLYLIVFTFESYSRLKNEQLSFFLSNTYLLLFAPVLFFFGMSLIFNFRSSAIGKVLLGYGLTLYDVVAYFVNIVYYSLINVYIYKEKALKHAA